MTSVTLSLPYDLTADQWCVVDEIFRGMDGWLGYESDDNTPQWYGTSSSECFVWASVEPSGLLVVGNLDSALWTRWISALSARLSHRLGFDVRDADG